MIRHGPAREAMGLAWRALLVWFVLVYLGRSLLILAAIVALVAAVLAAVLAAVAVGVWALLVHRRGW